MRGAALVLLEAMDEPHRARACHDFHDPSRVRWTYVPATRPGARLADIGHDAAKAAHRLLATALSPHAFAQATTIMGLEEVLDRAERGRIDRHRDHYWVVLYGSPAEHTWAWRFEGHHLSVTATITGEDVSPTPLFLGAHPAAVSYAGLPMVRPLTAEEELARGVLEALGPQHRGSAIVSERPPGDIHTADAAHPPGRVRPVGVARGELAPDAAACLDRLVRLYLDRLEPGLAESGTAALQDDPDQVRFAWEGSPARGEGHYYRVQAPRLLIEYDNTQDNANHAHSVLRRPGDDFGAQLLRVHRATERSPG